MTPRIVLDASALLAYVLKEPGFDTVAKLLPVAVVPAPNLTEVLYRAGELGHRIDAYQLHAKIAKLGVAVEPFTSEDVLRSAELVTLSRASSTTGSLSLADAACLAVAERLGLPVTGADQEWEALDLHTEFRPFR